MVYLKSLSTRLTLEHNVRAARLLMYLSVVMCLSASPVWAEDYSWGPEIGTRMSLPEIEGKDHTATTRSLSSLAGENALLIFFNRSADW